MIPKIMKPKRVISKDPNFPNFHISEERKQKFYLILKIINTLGLTKKHKSDIEIE